MLAAKFQCCAFKFFFTGAWQRELGKLKINIPFSKVSFDDPVSLSLKFPDFLVFLLRMNHE